MNENDYRSNYLKVTMIIEGNVGDVHEIIHRDSRNFGVANEEISNLRIELDREREKLYETSRERDEYKQKASQCDQWIERYYEKFDLIVHANSKISALERQLHKANEANEKLRLALKAATGNSDAEHSDAEHSDAGNLSTSDVDYPVVNRNFHNDYSNEKYPFGLLKGDRDLVRKQALACFINDPDRKNKIAAIKTLRARTGFGLKESKDLIEWAMGVGDFANR